MNYTTKSQLNKCTLYKNCINKNLHYQYAIIYKHKQLKGFIFHNMDQAESNFH